jgi:predicted transcriptional regulator
MTRNQAITTITTVLPTLSDERVQLLAEITQSWAEDANRPPEDDETRAAIAEGIAQDERGELATDAEVEEAYRQFRK